MRLFSFLIAACLLVGCAPQQPQSQPQGCDINNPQCPDHGIQHRDVHVKPPFGPEVHVEEGDVRVGRRIHIKK